MKRKAWTSEPLPISFEFEDYVQGHNDIIYYAGKKDKDPVMNLSAYLKLVKDDDKRVKHTNRQSSRMNNTFTLLPSRKLALDVDLDNALGLDFIPEPFRREVRKNDSRNIGISTKMRWNVKGGSLEKKDLIMLDMINNINKDGWKRPIYFSTTLGNSNFLNLKKFMFLEGLAYRLTPCKHGNSGSQVNIEVMEGNMMNKFHYREMANPEVFYDENYKRFVYNLRLQFFELSRAYLGRDEKVDKQKAKKVLDFCFATLPDTTFPYEGSMIYGVDLLYRLDEDEKAKEILMKIGDRNIDKSNYYKQNPSAILIPENEIKRSVQVIGYVGQLLETHDESELAKEYQSVYNSYPPKYKR